jgi:hypothetical protein
MYINLRRLLLAEMPKIILQNLPFIIFRSPCKIFLVLQHNQLLLSRFQNFRFLSVRVMAFQIDFLYVTESWKVVVKSPKVDPSITKLMPSFVRCLSSLEAHQKCVFVGRNRRKKLLRQ